MVANANASFLDRPPALGPDKIESDSLLPAEVEPQNHTLGNSKTAHVGKSQGLDVQRIGPYRIHERLAEGGMGIVFAAEQTEPVRRNVAIKVIKPGMDSKQVIARFEAERQALALMEHPNIANVIDAGTTENGLPFFVMELIRGIPITQYCDRAKMSIRGRVELVRSACAAIQHAHNKGIIHRDIKPGN
ncbi:MAG: protein kinase, partial [Planctomycetales bacterium]|nr:protein kinase [Planctomycetales bacterium]